ncbi:MAG: 3-phosphoshikimate 1-carboxyvinyltransferase [Bacteroidota bacterium]
MNLFLDFTDKHITNIKIIISGSKSESNRLLVLQQFFNDLRLENLSDSDDTKHLQEALSSNNKIIDIGHAGTAMRFLTAYFSVKEGSEIILTGSERMQNRPIEILVEALQSLGADIQYLNKSGFPPLEIKGKNLISNKVRIQGNVSSQYISALLLIAPSLQNGLEIELLGDITSIPYIKMTLVLLDEIGVSYSWGDNIIKIAPLKSIKPNTIVVESDWSSASYFYSLVALSEEGTSLSLLSYKKGSLQGDSSLVDIYKHFGVATKFNNGMITLSKIHIEPKPLSLNLVNYPDIAQTIAVTCLGLGVACDLTGLHTLKIKETDRLVALKNELEKLGAQVNITDESLHLEQSDHINKNIAIDTYNDHRMAMAFAPLALKVPLTINDAEVVTKSFTSFWEVFESVFI